MPAVFAVRHDCLTTSSQGSAIVDHFGRRRLTLTASGMLVILLAIISALLSNPNTSSGRSSAGISFIYLFMVVFSFGWTPMSVLLNWHVVDVDFVE